MKKRFFRLLTAVLLIVAITVLSLSILPYALSQPPLRIISFVHAQTVNDMTLYGSATQGWGFTKESMSKPGPQIEFQQGELYNITLISVDGFLHNFFIDYNDNAHPDSDEPTSPNFSSTINYQFTPDRTGEYTYYCWYHFTTMYGNSLIVPEFGLPAMIIITTVLGVILVFYKKRMHTRFISNF